MQMQPITEFTENRSRPIEWPTWIAIAGLWFVFAALIYFHADLPWWVLTPVGAWLVAFHGSLQHEAIHGHPTRSHLLNELLLFPAISVWIPYRRYRRLHLTHHRNDQLTDPEEDPESYYLDPQAWERTPNALRWLYTVNNTMLGRFILGPAITTTRLVASEIAGLRRGERDILSDWLLHAVGIAIVWFWVSWVCGMPFWQYVVGIAYWGNSLTMMRSYAEHRAHDQAGCRVIIVEVIAAHEPPLSQQQPSHAASRAAPSAVVRDPPLLSREPRPLDQRELRLSHAWLRRDRQELAGASERTGRPSQHGKPAAHSAGN